MRQAGSSRRAIARALGRAYSTVSRELRRNTAAPPADYDHAQAQRLANARRSRRGHRKRTKEAIPVLAWLLREGFTAGQIALLAIGPSERSCYRLIAMDRAAGGTLYRHLPRGRRPRRRACRWRRGPIPDRRDISERPVAANERSEFGHWEGDLVEGLHAKSFLLVLRERKSRFCRIMRVLDKRSDTVANALILLLRPFQASFRSLTLDNGGEFADHTRVAAALDRPASVFFARPYRASDKGSVEQLNGLIRRRFPKRTDFRTVPAAAFDALRDHLNVCPLHVTGGRPPSDFFHHLCP
jgi:transposase, IS30 family